MSWAQHDKTLQETIAFADKRKLLLVIIQIQEALWRKLNKLKPLISRRGLQEVKENALK